MTQSNEITIVGNLTADPELRFTQSGVPVANLTIASSERVFDRQANEWKDGDPLFLRGSVWRELGEHVAASLTKGQRVIVSGKIKQTNYQDREGNQRTGYDLVIDEIGPSLRFGTTSFTRVAKSGQADQAAPVAAPVAAPAPVNQPQAAPQAPAPQVPAAPAPQQVPAGVAAGQALSDDAF